MVSNSVFYNYTLSLPGPLTLQEPAPLPYIIWTHLQSRDTISNASRSHRVMAIIWISSIECNLIIDLNHIGNEKTTIYATICRKDHVKM